MAARILVLQDKSLMELDIVSTLHELGYEAIDLEGDAELAFGKLEKDLVDLVLMDASMQGANEGLPTAEHIRSKYKVPVIFLSAYADNSSGVRSHQAQSFEVLVKPYNKQDLKASIEISLYKHQMEKKLRQSEERWASLVTSAPNMILLVNRDFQVSFINHMPQHMAEADRNDLFKYFDTEYHLPVMEAIRRTLDQGKTGQCEISVTVPGEGVYWFDTQIGPTYENGNITGAMLIASDVTERKNTETILSQRLILEQTTAELSVIFTEFSDLDHSINKALNKVCNLREISWAALLVADSETNRIGLINECFMHGMDPILDQLRDISFDKNSAFRQPGSGGELINIYLPEQMALVGARNQQLFKAAGITALLVIPLHIGEQISGVLLFGSNRSTPWGADDINLMNLLGNLVRGALERQRAEQAERLARQQSEALRNAMTVLTAELDEEVVLNSVLVELGKILPFDLASVFLYEDQVPHMRVLSGDRELSSAAKTVLFPRSQYLTALLAQRHLSYVPEIEPIADIPAPLQQLKSWVSVPLASHGQHLGHLVVFSRKLNAFHASDLRLVQAFADQAAIGIENAQLYASTHRQSITDELTQIWNRRHFFRLAQVEFARSERYNLPLSAIMIDIDYFKKVNDQNGHAAGDKVLRLVAQRLKQDLRSVDLLARYGGEEFIVLLVQTGPAEARQVAERLRSGIQTIPFHIGEKELTITASLGVSARSPKCNTLDELLSSADLALYQAKQNGRNRVEIHPAD